MPQLERRSTILTPGAHPLDELRTAGDAEVLVIDQFEELFTLCRDDDERRRFLDELLDVADRGTRVIIALRADFYGHCAAYPRLAAVLEDHQALVGPMVRKSFAGRSSVPPSTPGSSSSLASSRGSCETSSASRAHSRCCRTVSSRPGDAAAAGC